MHTLHSQHVSNIDATICVPGDKSISHRVAILGGLATGATRVSNFLCSEDCLNTLRAMQQLGVKVHVHQEQAGYGATHFSLLGVGMQPTPPIQPIDCGNSGTGMRLLAGILATCPFTSTLWGDESLSTRPMGRIITPLTQMGADIESTGKKAGCAPLLIQGRDLHPIDYTLPMASAQVKSAILLAALFTHGITTVRQPAITRDHTERLYRHFGISCTVSEDGLTVSTTGVANPIAQDITVPGDISSASFWLVAGAIIPGAIITLTDVGLNPTRDAIISVLRRMGANIHIQPTSPPQAGEPFGTITIYGDAPLYGTDILAHEIPNLIDEIPILAVAATRAQGTTTIRNAQELRVKETDRIATTAQNLHAMGADLKEWDDGLAISGGVPLHGTALDSFGDHRIAMSCLIAGLVADGITTVANTACINTSYPGFHNDLLKIIG